MALTAPIERVEGSHEFSTDPRDSTSLVFFDMCFEFATACAEVWPQDAVIGDAARRLGGISAAGSDAKTAEGRELAARFHADFSPHYAKIAAKDAAIFSLPLTSLSSISAAVKYASSDQGVRDTVWEYLRTLVQYAGMVDVYAKCPQAMLDSISSVAGELVGKLQSGELDASNMNPLQLGQMMMQSMRPEDLESFGQALLSGGNMDSMMNLMQSALGGGGLLGSMPAGLAGMMGGSGEPVPDMAMLASLMGAGSA